MKKFVALLLVLFVCLPVVAACSTLQGDNDKGATISMYLTDFPQTLDPAAVQLQADTAMIFSLIYQPLTTIDEKGKVKPGLAYEWYSYYDNRDEEYKMYFKLNETMWSDGISVSAGQGSVSVGKTVAFSITVPSGSEAWTYSVSWSGNLTLESGDTAPMGFEGDSRTNQLVFRANSTGTGTVSISAGSYCIAGKDYDASGSASVSS